MKRNFIISVVFAIICFLLLGGAIVLNIMEDEGLSMFFGMASTVSAFIAILFGLNSWKDK